MVPSSYSGTRLVICEFNVEQKVLCSVEVKYCRLKNRCITILQRGVYRDFFTFNNVIEMATVLVLHFTEQDN